MRASLVSRGGAARGVARELSGALLALGAGAALFLLLPRDSRSQAESARPARAREEAALCGAWHRGSGDTVPLDLEKVKRSYADLKARLTRNLEAAAGARAPANLRMPYDAGLPACREEGERSVALPPEHGRGLRGRTLYFARQRSPSGVVLPAEIERDPKAEILVVAVRSVRDLPELANRLGRPVSLASADFARALGVRCADSRVRVSEKGDSAVVYESR